MKLEDETKRQIAYVLCIITMAIGGFICKRYPTCGVIIGYVGGLLAGFNTWYKK